MGKTMEFHPLKIRRVIRETEECSSFELDVPEELKEAYRYRAGQHLMFEIPWEGGFTVRRCYSLSSAPEIDALPKVSVKRIEGGRVSNWMNDHLVEGQTVKVTAPQGRFVLDDRAEGERPLTLFAGGSGITPIISIAKSALVSTKRPVKLIYANRDRSSIIFDAELIALAKAHGSRLEIVHHLDDEKGFLRAEDVDREVAGKLEGDFYICGPTPFMECVEQALLENAVPEARIWVERFNSPLDPDRRDEEALAALPRSEKPTDMRLRMAGRLYEVPVPVGKTLLEAARMKGLNPPSSCEDGFCGSCMGQLRHGEVSMRATDALSEHDIERGKILLCQAVPATEEALEVDCDATSFRATPKEVDGVPLSRPKPVWAAIVFTALAAAAIFLRMTS